MSRRNRNTYGANPFVVLSDVTLTVILILLFYFTALLLAHANANKLAGANRKIEGDPRTALIEDHQQAVVNALTRSMPQKMAGPHPVIHVRASRDVQSFVFGESVLFKKDNSDLQPNGRLLIQEFGRYLGQALHAEMRHDKPYRVYPEIAIQGHTDSTGPAARNWELSGQRALNVLLSLRQSGVLDERHLSLSGYSYFQPYPGHGINYGYDMAVNRRIEIRLLYRVDDKQMPSVH
jgi:flagellar motor protein MotB